MHWLTLAQATDDATRALRLGNAWGVLLIISLIAFGVLILAARALRPGRHGARGARDGEGSAATVDPWEEAGRRLRADEEDDGTIQHDGVRNP
ncbi:MAG: hypothetical protein AB7G17_03850 [Phycisphaerales bacterium]